MHILVLRTYTADCEKIWLSLEAAGHRITVVEYDALPHDRQMEFVRHAEQLEPKIRGIVYIGAIERFHGRPCLQPEILKRLNHVAPMVHICSDGCEQVWWDLLIRYDRDECFAVQVSIDGVHETPISEMKRGLVLLTPIDPRVFVQKPWGARTRALGMSGSLGHGERQELVQALRYRLGMPWKEREGSYAGMAQFLCDCKLVINCPRNGTGDKDHVKGRVLEAAWAGACLIERRNAITSRWFPDDNYIQYDNLPDVFAKIEWARDPANETEVQARAEKLFTIVSTQHHPSRFWAHVFERAEARDEVS